MTRRSVILLASVAALLLAISPLARRALRAQVSGDRAGGAAVVLQPRAEGGSPFRSLDVYIDTGAAPLAAYQFELTTTGEGAAGGGGGALALVGIEGGEHAAFAEPPRYDPRALAAPTPRVIVAAFNTGRDLPTGRTRVARLMVRAAPGGGGDVPVRYQSQLTVAASTDAKPIEGARLEIVEGALP